MRNNTIIAICASALVALIAIFFFIPSIWEGEELTISPQQEQRDFAEAQDELNEQSYAVAADIAEKYKPFILDKSERGKKWIPIFLESQAKSRNAKHLLELFTVQPETFANHEEASIVVADALIKTFRADDYKNLRNQWKGKETQTAMWFVLDADELLIEGKRKEAIEYLSSRSFPGRDDSGRLVRLALLHVREQPRLAWEYLSEAQSKDPENPDIHTYRARLLEAIGKDSLALTEYLTAVRIDPTNVIVKDQLAEFYRRKGRYNEAITVWKQDFDSSPFDDFIWLKAWFWSHVVSNPGVDWNENKPPEGPIQPFLNYLYSLKEDQFWNESSFNRISDTQKYLNTQQATFWLRLIQALRDQNETEAWELLQFNRFSTTSWNPELENLLKLVLTYRKLGTFTPEEVQALRSEGGFGRNDSFEVNTPSQSQKKQHPFFKQIEAIAGNSIPDKSEIGPELKALLESPEVFSGCFLAAGWLEAAIDLNDLQVIPNNFPDWYAYGLTQALRFNRGALEALEFATKQKPTPPLDMLIGELLISSGSPDAGLEKLEKLADLDNDIGFRSSWLISLIQIEKGDYAAARITIASHPQLADSILGKETLARIALLQGNEVLADRLYNDLENSSWEAKSYLARRAFTERDYQRAKELTENLLREFPNNIVLRKNLQKIIAEKEKNESASSKMNNVSKQGEEEGDNDNEDDDDLEEDEDEDEGDENSRD